MCVIQGYCRYSFTPNRFSSMHTPPHQFGCQHACLCFPYSLHTPASFTVVDCWASKCRFSGFHLKWKCIWALVIDFILVGCILLRNVYITLSDTYLHRNWEIFIDVILLYFTTSFGPLGPSSGESQYISYTILRKPSLQWIRWSSDGFRKIV
jgi:hypothetical protein